MLDAIETLQFIWIVIGLFALVLFGRGWRRTRADVRYLRVSGKNGFRKIFVYGNRRRASAFVGLQLGVVCIGLVPWLPREWRSLTFICLLLYAAIVSVAMAVGEDRSYAQMEQAITEKERVTHPHTIRQEPTK